MINMGHCRFNNTVLALEECIEALDSDGLDELSDSEKTYAKGLYDLAKDYIDQYEKSQRDEKHRNHTEQVRPVRQ